MNIYLEEYLELYDTPVADDICASDEHYAATALIYDVNPVSGEWRYRGVIFFRFKLLESFSEY